MWTERYAVLNKRPDFDKLVQYGFHDCGETYQYTVNIVQNAFRFTVAVSKSGVTNIEVIDTKTEEEYTLAYVRDAVGSFVGAVRAEYEEILYDIVSSCYEPDIFKSEEARYILRYVRETYGSEAEYLWAKFPNNAIFREPTTQKWYAALLTVEKRKLGIDEDGTVEILDVKEDPKEIASLVDGVCYLPGYHMNKKHWYTIKLDGSVPLAEIYRRIDASFATLKLRRNKT